jgi:hypothetical protein
MQNLPYHELRELLRTTHGRTILAARSQHGGILDVLANDTAESVRAKVAESPHATTLTLERLSRDASGYVRWRVAQSSRAPAFVLKRLQSDRVASVRESAHASEHYHPLAP